jgi:hypothetical protein
MQFSISHASRRDDKVGKLLYLINSPTQYSDLEAIIVIQMHMHTGEGKVVMIMLH